MTTPLVGRSLAALAPLAFLVACQPDLLPPPPPPPPAVPSLASLAYSGTLAGNEDIYLIKADGTGKVRLTTHSATDAEPAWSPDGSKIAFRSHRDGNGEVYVMSAAFDGSATRLTNHAAADYQPAWSPDGSRIAFVSERDGNAEIYVMDVDGTNLVRLTSHIAPDRSPAWSPDGHKIAFSSERDGNGEIYVMDPDSRDLVRLTHDGADDIDPAWSPDGTKLAISRFVPTSGFTTCITVEDDYSSMCRWDVLIMNADGSGAARLPLPTGPGGGAGGWWRSVFVATDPAWSPDGREIAFAAFYCLSDLLGADCHGRNVILLGSGDGTGSLVELTEGTSPAWRP